MFIIVPLWYYLIFYIIIGVGSIALGIAILQQIWVILSVIFMFAVIFILLAKKTKKAGSGVIKTFGAFSILILPFVWGIMDLNLRLTNDYTQIPTQICLISFVAFLIYYLLLVFNEKSKNFVALNVIVSIALFVGIIIGCRTFYVSQEKLIEIEKNTVISILLLHRG